MHEIRVVARKHEVLLVGPPLSAVGGGPTHIRNMLASPLSDRYQLSHFETGSRGKESPAKDEAMAAKVLRLITGPLCLAWRLVRVRPDIVHINSVLDRKAFWRDSGLLLVSKLLRRKVVLQFHGGSLETLCLREWMRRLVRAVFSMADALIVLASKTKDELETLQVGKHVAVIFNGVDIRQFLVPGGRAHEGRVRHLLYLGRLVRDKGIFEAIEAIGVLRSADASTEVEFIIAGSGPDRAAIEKHVRTLGLEDCIKLVGPIHGDAKIGLLQRADVFLLPSYHEGLPYSVLESLAAGTPVIASRVGGIPDVVFDGVHGVLVDAKDAQQLAQALQRLRRAPETVRAMSKNCLERAASALGLERLATEFEHLYDDVLGQKYPHRLAVRPRR